MFVINGFFNQSTEGIAKNVTIIKQLYKNLVFVIRYKNGCVGF